MTICGQCEHHRHIVQNGAVPEVWYNHRCGAPSVQRAMAVDPVTGANGYQAGNSLGGIYLDKRPEPYCRDINKGDCQFFSPTEAALISIAG